MGGGGLTAPSIDCFGFTFLLFARLQNALLQLFFICYKSLGDFTTDDIIIIGHTICVLTSKFQFFTKKD